MLYLGCGIGLGILLLVQRLRRGPAAEAPLTREAIPLLGLVVLFGGVIAPVLLMVGLAQTAASTASLLLNVEGLATMGIAWIVFRENVDRRLLLGALAIVGACIAWGLDNNLTRKLSSADPVQIAMIKGLVAGVVNLSLGVGHGAVLPPVEPIAAVSVVGFFGYGVSLVFFVLGLRHLGSPEPVPISRWRHS